MRNLIASMRGKLFTIWCNFFRKGIYIGNGLKLYKKFTIHGTGKVHIGDDCIIDGIRGDDSQYVTIDTQNPDAVIIIGDHARIYASRISAKFRIAVGDHLLIEESGITDTDFHTIEKPRTTPIDETLAKCQINIGNRICVGAKSYITKGVTIEDDVIIFPGSIVTTPLKAGSIAAGNPARPMPAMKREIIN